MPLLYPETDLQHLNCSTDTHMTSGHETHPEDIQPIALGYDVWKADAWAESGMATKILFTAKKVSPFLVLLASLLLN